MAGDQSLGSAVSSVPRFDLVVTFSTIGASVMAMVFATAQLSQHNLFPSIQRWWPGLIASIALVYTCTCIIFFLRLVYALHANGQSTPLLKAPLYKFYLDTMFKKLQFALLYTMLTIGVMVWMPSADDTWLFDKGDFRSIDQVRPDQRASLTSAITTFYAVVAVTLVSTITSAVVSTRDIVVLMLHLRDLTKSPSV